MGAREPPVKITLVPSAVDGRGEEALQFLTSYLINETVGIDCGALGQYRTPADQSRIRHVLLSHTHIDHIGSLPVLVENAYEGKRDCMTVHGSPAVLDCLRRDIFNNRVWPDFRVIPTKEKPVLAFEVMPIHKPVTCQGLKIRAIPVHHPVYSVGYIIEGKFGAIAFSGDTGPTEELWRAINATPNLKAVFLELSFPSTMQWLADVSGHLTPKTVMSELSKLDRRGAKIYLYHLKPAVIGEVRAEVKALKNDFLHICELDEVYTIA